MAFIDNAQQTEAPLQEDAAATLFSQETSQLSKYQMQTALVGDTLELPAQVLHGAVAAVTDFAVSTFNSLTPKSMNADTADILNRIDPSALDVYNENPNTIQTLSLVGGIVAGGGIALKGLGMLRSGAKGMSFFTEAGQASRLGEVERLFAKSGAATDAYKSAKSSLYLASAANAIVDGVAVETAINLTMNAHPFMEDYYKDFGSNFLFNVGVDSVLGTGFRAIGVARKIAEGIRPVSEELTGQLDKLITVPDASMYQAGKLQIRSNNVENLQAAIDKAADPDSPLILTDYTISALKYIKTEEEARLVKDFQEMATGALADTKLAPEIRDPMINLLKRGEFLEVDKVEFAKVIEPVVGKLNEGFLRKTADLIKRNIDPISGIETVDTSKAIYSPVYNAFISKTEAANYLTLADVGKSVEELGKGIEKHRGALPRNDNSLEIRAQNTATVDADFAQSVLFTEKLNAKEIAKLVVAPDDLSMLKAIKTRLDALKNAGEDVSDIKILTTKAAPTFGAAEREALRKQGLDPQYGSKLKALEADWERFAVYNGEHGYHADDISPAIEKVSRDWVHGDTRSIREAYQASLEHMGYKGDAQRRIIEGLNEWRDHPRSRALRSELARISDADGNVYLYRGITRTAKGQRQIESFTTNPYKAKEFGEVRLYKVHVDDIIGTAHDFGRRGAEPEILVVQSTRENFFPADLDKLVDKTEDIGSDSFVVQKDAAAKTQTGQLGFDELDAHIYERTRKEIYALRKEGFGIESIALRTGTPLETVATIAHGGDTAGAGLYKYANSADVEAATAPTNRALLLSTTKSKVPTAEIKASLQKGKADSISDGLVEYHMRSSQSPLVRQIGESMYSDELRAQRTFIQRGLDQITLTGLKSTFFRSIDSALEGFGTTGALAAAFGKISINTKNAAKKQLVNPIGEALAKVASDEPALLELGNTINIYAATKGKVIYRDKQLWRLKEDAKLAPASILQLDDATFRASIDDIGIEAVQFAGKDFRVATASVDEALITMQKAGREMYHLKNTSFKATGQADLADRGMWIPALNVRDKAIAYAFDNVTRTTTMLTGNTLEELNAGIEHYRTALGKHAANVDIVDKSQQASFNTIAARHDPMTMAIADVSRQHGGASALAVVPTNTSMLKDIVDGYDSYLDRGIESLIEIQMAPIMEKLKNLSTLSQRGYDAGNLSSVQKMIKKPTDPGSVLRNVLLGRNNLAETQEWAQWQQSGQVFVDRALKVVSNILAPVITPITGRLNKGDRVERTAEEWKKIEQQMTDRGIVNPFQVLDDELGGFRVDSSLGEKTYLSQGKQSTTNLTPRAIVLSNALAATSILRVADVAQAFVNAVSLPILTSGAMSRRLEASFMDTSLDANAKFGLIETMHNGIRLMNHPVEGVKWSELAEKTNLFGADWREVNGILQQSRSFDPGVMTTLENAVESKLVSFLSKPADMSESFVRKSSFFTGVVMAKKAYPGLSDAGVMTFARNFMDQAIGNYTAAQRPVAFQGTFGVAMGLFQTYMVTLAQNTYRQIEGRQWKALARTMLTQQTIFGASSLPGFHPISEAIAEHYSDQNIDLETGTFRAISDPMASVILYGLPSQLVGITTRGDIQPRIPDPTNLSTLAAVQLTKQTYEAVERVAKAVGRQDGNSGRAMLEALSLQSISRPIARAAELINGYSITQQGNIVSTANEIYTPNGIISRLMATRPIEEIKAREAMHLNSMYGALDRDKRVVIGQRLKTHIRDGDLEAETVDKLAFEYMRTGSPTGWRSLVNGAMLQNVQSGNASVRDRLHPKSPTNLMIDDLD